MDILLVLFVHELFYLDFTKGKKKPNIIVIFVKVWAVL